VDEQRRAAGNVERGQATRSHLIDAATRLSAAHGYDGTTIEAVLAAANEVALMIARADDPAAALSDGQSAVAEFLDRLLADAVAPAPGTSGG
jgi:hypothetical protein